MKTIPNPGRASDTIDHRSNNGTMRARSTFGSGHTFRRMITLPGLRLAVMVWSWLGILAAEPLEEIRTAATARLESEDITAGFKRTELAKKYAVALDGLEKKMVAAGDLDAVLHVREEKTEVEKSGATTAHADAELVKLREIYEKELTRIDEQQVKVRAGVGAMISGRIREEEAALTKAGKVEEALALRKAGNALVLELTGPAGAADLAVTEDPRVGEGTELQPLEPIEVPDEKPPFFDEPFKIKGRWLEPLRVPAAKQKIREVIMIGDRAKKKWPTVEVTQGSTWIGSDSGRVELSAGTFLAEKCRFDRLPLGADLACRFFLRNCDLENCRLEKAGVWYGGHQAGKFYLKDCVIRGSFSGPINVVDNGFRLETCVFEDVELPPMWFREHQAADYLNHPWLRVVNCRFVKCKIPASFLYLTRDCIFEDCTFEDDPEKPENEAEIFKPFEIVLYVRDCKSRMTKVSDKVAFTEKPETDLKGVTIPTAAALLREITK